MGMQVCGEKTRMSRAPGLPLLWWSVCGSCGSLRHACFSSFGVLFCFDPSFQRGSVSGNVHFVDGLHFHIRSSNASYYVDDPWCVSVRWGGRLRVPLPVA